MPAYVSAFFPRELRIAKSFLLCSRVAHMIVFLQRISQHAVAAADPSMLPYLCAAVAADCGSEQLHAVCTFCELLWSTGMCCGCVEASLPSGPRPSKMLCMLACY
jgi:hypothetical protein